MRRGLTLVTPAEAPARPERVRFCSHCGRVSETAEFQADRPGTERVCQDCGMGMLLTAPHEALARAEDPFLIVTEDLRVNAVSATAEKLFGAENGLLGSSLLSTISSPAGDEALARAVRRAATGMREVVELPVRPAAVEARRAGVERARIAACGPPRAALVVVRLGADGA